jgi:CRP-like cAMP-binding protein
MTEEDKDDEQFYRDTESIAFRKLDDRQLALLEPLGKRRTLPHGEFIFKAGQRGLGLTVILRGEIEVFEARDGTEQILATARERDFIGDVAMLQGTSALATARVKSKEAEVLEVPAAEIRRALAELPGLGGPIVKALIMRRRRLMRDREFAGLRIIALRDAREGHQLHDFLDKNRIPHRLIEFETEQGRALCQRLHLTSRDLPTLVTATGAPLAPPIAARSCASGRFASPAGARGRKRNHLRPNDRRRWSSRSCRSGLCGVGRVENRRLGKLRARRAGRLLFLDRKLFRVPHRNQRRRLDLSRAASGVPIRREIFHAGAGALAQLSRCGRISREPANRSCTATLRAKCVLIASGGSWKRQPFFP